MALDKARLKTDLKTMADSANAEKWNQDQTLQALADAIDRFVRGADVIGVKVAIEGITLDQTNKGAVQ
jgi:hypothetical protein